MGITVGDEVAVGVGGAAPPAVTVMAIVGVAGPSSSVRMSSVVVRRLSEMVRNASISGLNCAGTIWDKTENINDCSNKVLRNSLASA